MKLKLFVLFSLLPLLAIAGGKDNLITPYELHKSNYTATYHECIDWYKRADSAFETVKMLNYGITDAGFPLNAMVYSADKDFYPRSLHRRNKRIILILNAIHPGEPEGVDASMLFLRDIATQKEYAPLLTDVVLVIIPMYNIEGVLNRSSYSRANQNGPESYGFRGNGENLDLNRDFIKCDSKNARAFTQLFQDWQPDVLLDNHTSDGADYQYTLTYIANAPHGLPKDLGDYVKDKLTPGIGAMCKKQGFEMVPYVETVKETPDSGIEGFNSLPRYSNGYASLWNTISYTVETHMLKPFDQRLKATYEFMKACLREVHTDADEIGKLRAIAIEECQRPADYVLKWEEDTSRYDLIDFKGYTAGYKASEVTNGKRLYYDRQKPFTKKVRFYNYFKPVVKINKPSYYILPQAWWKVVELLQLNNIQMSRLDKDTTLSLEMYIIEDYTNPNGQKPNNGHYTHANVKLHSETQKVSFHKGDYIISTDQPGMTYILETLEPQAADSYLAWNFFDGVLQQREYYSDYVFEDLMAQYLKDHPELRTELESKKKSDTAFAANPRAQLDWTYRHSPYFEKTVMRYPVGRIMNKVKW